MIAREGCEAGVHCVTCSDEALPMCVVAVHAELGSADCALYELAQNPERSSTPPRATSLVEVLTGIIPEVRVGDILLVHAGAALARLQDEETTP